MTEDQRVYAAATLSRQVFCIAVVEPDPDNPFSFILTYDGSFLQPWARVDAQRVINSIVVAGSNNIPAAFVALSGEGDVYLLGNEPPATEKILGAGIFSPDAMGLGSTIAIADIAGDLHVCGDSGQLYRRGKGGAWAAISGPSLSAGPRYSDLTLKALAGLSAELIYVCGSATPARRKPTADDDKALEEAAKRGDAQRMVEIMNSTMDPGIDYTIEGRAFFGNAAGWTMIPLPNRHGLHDVFIEAPDKVWLVGFHGTILLGSAAKGFQSVGFHGDTERILSFTKFGDRYVAASDNALHWFNGHNLSPLRPTTLTRIATPLKVQAVDDVLFYFDYTQGVHRFDGKIWEEVPIPPQLLERDFKGLPPRRP